MSSQILQAVKNMKVEDFGAILNDGTKRSTCQIIDVRELNELAVASIKGDDIIHLPLSTAGAWSPKVESGELLDSTKPTLCLCHHGMRSMKLAGFLGSGNFKIVFMIPYFYF
jgi:rhodanese-related sulfurtransferase